jgi:hypothetical protein
MLIFELTNCGSFACYPYNFEPWNICFHLNRNNAKYFYCAHNIAQQKLFQGLQHAQY